MTTKRGVNEKALTELLQLIDARKAVEREIYETKQAYIWEFDDEKAETIRRKWRALEKKHENAKRAINDFYDSLDIATQTAYYYGD